jgi:hypothetical protein
MIELSSSGVASSEEEVEEDKVGDVIVPPLDLSSIPTKGSETDLPVEKVYHPQTPPTPSTPTPGFSYRAALMASIEKRRKDSSEEQTAVEVGEDR